MNYGTLLVSKGQAESFAVAFGNLALGDILRGDAEWARGDAMNAATFAFAYLGMEYREGDEREQFQIDESATYGKLEQKSYFALLSNP